MFSQIAGVHRNRVEVNLTLLADIGTLAEPLDPEYRRALDAVLAGLSQVGPGARETFITDHLVHRWLRTVRTELLAGYDGGSPEAARPTMNEMLVHFELALAVMAGSDYEFTLGPCDARRFLLAASGAVVDLKTGPSTPHCRYVASDSEIEVAGLRLPLVCYTQDCGIMIVDANLDLFADPTGGQYPVELDNSINSANWTTTLARALDLVRRDPLARELVTKFVRYLVPLKQVGEVRNLSFSARSLPGVIFKNNELEPHLIGETLVHEADHQFFYAIDQLDAVWASDVRLHRPAYYSPWRDDPRPLDGILRGLSSFTRVSRYYATLLSVGAVKGAEQTAAAAMLAKRLSESEIALRTVLESGELSAFGAAYVDDLQHVLSSVIEVTSTVPRFDELRSRALEEIIAHRKVWDAVHGRASRAGNH